jgi:hypothetical protein
VTHMRRLDTRNRDVPFGQENGHSRGHVKERV